jgi:peptidoglycan/LPS O-acetylase OafA/YrhL
MRSEKSIYFKNLDSIRFFAALMVFLQHGISNSYQYLGLENTVLGRILDVISAGDTGVSIFFVLSGFLITYLLISEHELNQKVDVKKFYIRRFLRIWPLFYAVIFFSFVVYPGSKALLGVNTPLDSNFIYHIFFLSNFDVINILQLKNNFIFSGHCYF